MFETGLMFGAGFTLSVACIALVVGVIAKVLDS